MNRTIRKIRKVAGNFLRGSRNRWQGMLEVSPEKIRRPNFLVIGTQKAGTSWLFKNLAAHPDVFMSPGKELEFFNDPRKIKRLGLDGYLAEHFREARGEQRVGEATPIYIWDIGVKTDWREPPRIWQENIPETVASMLGDDVKIVATVRDPIERAISGYFHHMSKGRIERTRSLIDMRKHHGIVHLGFYYAHLQSWINTFGPDNVHVMVFEEMTREPMEAFKRLFAFLDVDDAFRPPYARRVVYKGVDRLRRGNNFYLPKQGFEAIPSDRISDDQLELIVTEAQYDSLREIFLEESTLLMDYLQRDLSDVWPSLNPDLKIDT